MNNLSKFKESYLQKDLPRACGIWIAKFGLSSEQQESLLNEFKDKNIFSSDEIAIIRQEIGNMPWDQWSSDAQKQAEQWLEEAARRKTEPILSPGATVPMSAKVKLVISKVQSADGSIKKDVCYIWMQKLDLDEKQRKDCLDFLYKEGILTPAESNELARQIPNGTFVRWDALPREEQSAREKWLDRNRVNATAKRG